MGRTLYDPVAMIVERACTVYTLTEPLKTDIQLQKCPKCPATRHRFIGPDLRELGIFNYNNNALFTHELLDEYTSAFTTSETPFVAWATVVSRRYALRGHSFVSDGMLRSAWFAYVRIQQFEGDMQCTRCGPSPEHVVWDGVTPPTHTEDDSPIRKNRKYVHDQQILADRKSRDLVRKAATMPTLPVKLQVDTLSTADMAKGDSSAQKGPDETAKLITEASAALKHIRQVTEAGQMLTHLNEGLGTYFSMNYGVEAYKRQVQPSSSCRLFFGQVSGLFDLE
jgi:hypothetical protein